MKPHPVPGTRCSTEDLADDEREDTSDAEQEPEPDYDEEPIGNNIRDHQMRRSGSNSCPVSPSLVSKVKLKCLVSFCKYLPSCT